FRRDARYVAQRRQQSIHAEIGMVADFQVQVGRLLFDRAAQKIVNAQCHGDSSQLSGFEITAKTPEIFRLWPSAKVAPAYRPSKQVVGPGSGLVTLSGGTGLRAEGFLADSNFQLLLAVQNVVNEPGEEAAGQRADPIHSVVGPMRAGERGTEGA